MPIGRRKRLWVIGYRLEEEKEPYTVPFFLALRPAWDS